ncbi:MAG: prephenate dehydrogenase/arogenate dehydrogenase family protein [Promicromonosporaceae bacterium]|nr:prephenate dehydrogenase/arogenate dehydrogenase family protein [Promicromonosporaceae bacterium]
MVTAPASTASASTTTAEPPFDRVAVLGLGLIGGSLLRQLHAAGVAAAGWAHREETAAVARAAGLAASTDLAQAVTGADLVILAVPLRHMRDVAAQFAAHLALTDDATVIDVGSVKVPVHAALNAVGLGHHFVGAHPMAGNEHSGFSASSAALLVGAPWAVTSPASPARLGAVVDFIGQVLDGHAIVLDEHAHDEIQALISGLPHVLAVSLLNQVAASQLQDTALRLAAGSFQDGTRVARTDPDRTAAMITQNSAAVAAALRRTIAELTDLASRLEGGLEVDGFFHRADSLR